MRGRVVVYHVEVDWRTSFARRVVSGGRNFVSLRRPPCRRFSSTGVLWALLDKIPNVEVLEMLLPVREEVRLGLLHEVHLAVAARPHPDYVRPLVVPLVYLFLDPTNACIASRSYARTTL